MQNAPVYLAVSLDVEEEGLFCGKYAQSGVTVDNTRSLPKLEPLFALGVRPTLFCAYPVFKDARSCEELHKLAGEGAEIAAHLHFWNTPPLPGEAKEALWHVPAGELAPDLFAAKLESVLEAGYALEQKPLTSFRMGRWDIHHFHWPLLAKAGILTDASVRPLHGKARLSANPDHFAAPNGPYWIATPNGHVFEVPLTVTPLLSCIPSLLTRARKGPSGISDLALFLASTTNYWGALALLPAYHPLFAMQLITQIYLARGGRMLSLTWHSSEMHAGATPHLPTEAHVDALLAKVRRYVEWLMQSYTVCCLPMSELRTALGPTAPVMRSHEDWAWNAGQIEE